MAHSFAALRASLKRWSAELVMNSTSYTVVNQLPTRSMGMDRQRSTCSVVIKEFPDCAPGDLATVLITLNGETVTFFIGQVDSRPMQDDSGVWTVNLLDAQHLLAKRKTVGKSWKNVSFVSAITQLFDLAGIPAEQRGSIWNAGSDFTLGPNYAIKFKGEYVVADLMNDILDWAGGSVYVGPNGKLSIIEARVFPDESTAVYTYSYGASLFDDELGYTSASRTIGGFEGATRSFKASGPRRPDRQIPDATFTMSGIVGGKDEEKEYQYIQTNECAEAVARREIVRLNRVSTEVSVDAPLNVNLRPGDTVLFRDPLLQYPVNEGAIVVSESTTGDGGMTLLLSVGSRPPDGDITLTPPPKPNFSYKIDRQPIALAGVPEVRTLVQIFDQSSDPSGFAITKLSWSATCDGTVTPIELEWSKASDDDGEVSATEKAKAQAAKNPVFVFSTLDGAEVTLIAESESGEGASKTKAINPPDVDIVTRVLSVAAPEGWRVLANAAGWRMFNPGSACTAVPNINTNAPPIAGFSNGKIFQTLDYLFTPPTLLSQVQGQINALFVNLTDPALVLAAHGNAVSRSSDGGASWTLLTDFGAQVNYVEDDQVNPNLILACAGNKLFKSADGASFFVGLEGPAGSVARKASVAPGGTAVAFSNTDLANAVLVEGGGTVDWSQVPVEKQPVSGCSSLCLLPNMTLLATTGFINDAVGDPSYPQISYLATGAPGGHVYVLREGGPGYVARYLYTTNDAGPLKAMNLSAAYPIDTATAAYRMGYLGVSDKPPPPQLILLPSGQSGERDMLFHYITGVGWQPKALPLPAQQWQGLRINPALPMQWIIWAGERAFYTPNAALSWIELSLPHSGGSWLEAEYSIVEATFTGQGSNWIVQMWAWRGWGASRGAQSYIATGNGTSTLKYLAYGSGMSGKPPIEPNAPDGSFFVAAKMLPGLSGEVIIHGSSRYVASNTAGVFFETPYQLASFQPGSLTPRITCETCVGLGDTFSSSTRELLGVEMSNIGYGDNYLTSSPAPFISAGTSVVSLQSGIFVGGRAGIAQILDMASAPRLLLVAGGNNAVGQIVRGRRRAACAARGAVGGVNSHIIYSFNGESWTTIDVPEVFIIRYPDGTVQTMGGLADILGVVEP